MAWLLYTTLEQFNIHTFMQLERVYTPRPRVHSRYSRYVIRARSRLLLKNERRVGRKRH